MASAFDGKGAIVQKERGLTTAGTRITLYDVMDYVTVQYPSKVIQGVFDLTKQIDQALTYIETDRAEAEAEAQQVLAEAEELRQHYEAHCKHTLAGA